MIFSIESFLIGIFTGIVLLTSSVILTFLLERILDKLEIVK